MIFNSTSELARPPNRFLLRWFERLGLPFASILAIFPIVLMLWSTSARIPAILWGLFSFVLLFTTIYVRYTKHKVPLIDNLIGLNAGGKLGVMVWCLAVIIYIVAANHLGIVPMITLWPVFIPPFVIFIIGKNKNRAITPHVIILTLLTFLILSIGEYISWSGQQKGLYRENLPTLSMAISGILWTGIAFPIVYYAVRRSQLNQIRAETLQQVMYEFIHLEDPIHSADTLARLLYERADVGKRVIILFYNKLSDDLWVVACAGNCSELVHEYRLPKDRGVSRRAIREQCTQYVKDVRKDPDFISGGLPGKGSEVSVPIIAKDESGNKMVIGTINVQEDVTHAFFGDDIRTIELFAAILASVSQKYYISQQKEMIASLQILNDLTDPELMAEKLVEIAGTIFNCPLVCYWRLAPGTGFPSKRPIFKGDLRDSDFLVSDALYEQNSNFIQWISAWRERFFDQFSLGEAWTLDGPGFNSEFQYRESIRAMCFLPIGTPKVRVGVLVFFFHQPVSFYGSEKMNLLTFASVVTPHLLRVEYLTSVLSGFARPQLYLHRILGQSGLDKGAWEIIFDEVIELPDVKSCCLDSALERYRTGIKRLIEDLRLWDASQKYTNFLGVNNFVSLGETLNQSFVDLEYRFGGKIVWVLDPLIELESNELKMIIFSIVIEAVHNAFIHGETTAVVYVGIARNYDEIILDISDDGQGFDVHHVAEDGNFVGGIFDIARIAKQILGATVIWPGTKVGQGTSVSWRIPALPEPQALDRVDGGYSS